jgi:hypothetical protein
VTLPQDTWKLKYSTMQKYNIQKNPLKNNQNPSRYYNSITNLKSQHNSQNTISQKSSYKNTICNPEATILYNESKQNILAVEGKASKCWNIGPKGCKLASSQI